MTTQRKRACYKHHKSTASETVGLGLSSPLSAAAARVWREELSSSALLVAAVLLKRDGERTLRFLEWTPLLTSTS